MESVSYQFLVKFYFNFQCHLFKFYLHTTESQQQLSQGALYCKAKPYNNIGKTWHLHPVYLSCHPPFTANRMQYMIGRP